MPVMYCYGSLCCIGVCSVSSASLKTGIVHMRRRQKAEQDFFAANHLEGPCLLAAASLA